MYARIENGTVAELIESDIDPSPLHHPTLVYVQVPPEWRNLIAYRCRYTAGKFEPPLQMRLDTGETVDGMAWLAHRARAGIRSFAADARVQAAGTDDPVEIASWPAKEAMAKRHQAATTDAGDDAALQAEADLAGKTVPDLVTGILAKAANHKLATGKIKGWQDQAETLVAAELATGNADAMVLGLATLKAQATAELQVLLAQLQA
jgi:hypothetical protein